MLSVLTPSPASAAAPAITGPPRAARLAALPGLEAVCAALALGAPLPRLAREDQAALLSELRGLWEKDEDARMMERLHAREESAYWGLVSADTTRPAYFAALRGREHVFCMLDWETVGDKDWWMRRREDELRYVHKERSTAYDAHVADVCMSLWEGQSARYVGMVLHGFAFEEFRAPLVPLYSAMLERQRGDPGNVWKTCIPFYAAYDLDADPAVRAQLVELAGHEKGRLGNLLLFGIFVGYARKM